MEFQSLERGRFIRREDDNHARVQLLGGAVVVARCPSEKSFAAKDAPGQTVELSRINENGSERHWNLERLWFDKSWIGLNAAATIELAKESVIGNAVDTISGYQGADARVPFAYDDGSVTVDLKFSGAKVPDLYMDVRNVTRIDDDVLKYPNYEGQEDPARLDGLEAIVEQGHRAVILFAINRAHGEWFEAGYDVDSPYCERLQQVVEVGVELMVTRIRHQPSAITITGVAK